MVLAEVPEGKCCSWVTRVDLFCWAMSNLEIITQNDAALVDNTSFTVLIYCCLSKRNISLANFST